MKNTISVALATYNGAKFIEKQLNSILNQTYKNYNIVIVDDCSQDETVKILKSYKKNNPNKITLYLNSENLGYIKNFEKAILLCDGKYIALCDQDDIWLEEKLETLVEGIENNYLICSDAFLISEDEKIIHNSFIKYSSTRIPRKNDFKSLVFKNFVTGCTAMIDRELLKIALPFPGPHCPHDWWLAFAANKMGGIKFVDKPLVKYRQHFSNSIGAKRKTSKIELIRNLLKKRENKYRDSTLELQIKRIWDLKTSNIFNSRELNILDESERIMNALLYSDYDPKSIVLILKYIKYLV